MAVAASIPNLLSVSRQATRLKPLTDWVFYLFILFTPYRTALWITDFWNVQKVLGCLLLACFGLLLLRGHVRVPPIALWLCVGLLAVRVACAAAAFAFGGHVFNLPMIVSWAQFLAILLMTTGIVQTQRDARRALIALLISGALSCVVFLTEYKLASQFMAEHGVSDDQPVRELGFSNAAAGDSGKLFKDRENDIDKTLDLKLGAVGDPTNYSLFLLCLLPVYFEFLRDLHQNRSICAFAFTAFGLALNYLTILMSYSRTAWVLAVVITLIILRRYRANRRKLAAVFLLLAVLALPVLQAMNALPALMTRTAELMNLFTDNWQKDDSGQMRVAIQKAAVELTTYNPLFGVGLGNFSNEAVRYSGLEVAQSAENLYLQVLAEGGVMTVALCAPILFLVTRRQVFGRALEPGLSAAIKLAFGVFLLMSLTIDTEFQAFIYIFAGVLLSAGIEQKVEAAR